MDLNEMIPKETDSPDAETNGESPVEELDIGSMKLEEKESKLKYDYKDDQWSPINTMGKKQYDCKFLKELANDPITKNKPVFNSCDILDLVVRHGDVGAIPNMSRHDMMPNFARGQMPRGNSRGSQSKQSPRVTKTGSMQGPKSSVIRVTISLREDIKLNESENAWKPTIMKKGAEVSDEGRQTQEIYKAVRGILNKLTPEKFDKLVADLKQLKIDTVERLEGVIDLVFVKAIDEPNFAVFYAHMCKEVEGMSVLAEQQDKKKSFRYMIISRCQKEFETEKNFEKSAERAEMLKAIEECDDAEKKKELNATLDNAERKVRMKSLGNIKFIGELFKLRMLSSKTMVQCIDTLLADIQEEKLEYLCKLLTTTGSILEVQAETNLAPYFQRISRLLSKKDNRISSRVRFMLQDVIELRANNWVPRRTEVKAKTLDQIEQDAEEEHKKVERMNATTPKGRGGDRRDRDDRRGGGRRDGRHDDGWTTAQSRPRANIDQAKLQKLGVTNITETKLGPSKMSWSRGSNAKSGASRSMGSPTVQSPVAPAPTFTAPNKYSALDAAAVAEPPDAPETPKNPKQYSKGASIERSTFKRQDSRARKPEPEPEPEPEKPLTEEDTERISARIVNCMNEYLSEATKFVHVINELEETSKPNQMPVILREILNVTLQHSQPKMHILMRDLIFNMIKSGLITLDRYVECLNENILSIANDLSIDLPKLYEYIALWLAPHIKHQDLTLERLWKIAEANKSELNSAKLFGNVVKQLGAEYGKAFAKRAWLNGGLKGVDFGADFLKDYAIEYVESDEDFGESSQMESKAEVCALTPDETQKMLFSFLQKNKDLDYVSTWVKNNVGAAATEGWFVRALVRAVCEDALMPPGQAVERQPRVSPRNDQRICHHVPLLSLYIENKENRELESLFAMQQLLNDYEHPSGVGLQLFQSFLDYEVISNEGFIAWQQDADPKEQKGKGVLVKSLNSFFTMLSEQDNDSGEDD